MRTYLPTYLQSCVLQFSITDEQNTYVWMTSFDDIASNILDNSIDDFQQLKETERDQLFGDLYQKQYIFRLKRHWTSTSGPSTTPPTTESNLVIFVKDAMAGGYISGYMFSTGTHAGETFIGGYVLLECGGGASFSSSH